MVGYVATIYLANWAIQRWGVVPVGFGLLAPAGVYFAGLAFTLRDLVHETLGRGAVLGAIVVGALFSWQISSAFAFASGFAFLVSELVDMAVYSPLREGRPKTALFLSNVAGAVVDSAIFLWIAFGSLAFFWGQVVGKVWVTLPFVLLVWLAQAWVGPKSRPKVQPSVVDEPAVLRDPPEDVLVDPANHQP